MKVVYVLNTTQVANGATKAFVNMFNGLIGIGIEPLVVVPDGNEFCEILKGRGIKTLVLNYRPATYPPVKNLKNTILFLPKLLARIFVNQIATHKLQKEALIFGADLIHTNVSVINIGLKAAQKLKIPHITHIREYCNKYFNIHLFPTHNLYIKNFRKENSYSICITKDISKYYHIENQNNSWVIYDGVLRESDVKKDKSKEKYFLFVGRLEEGKGISDLIRAYANLCKVRKDAYPLLVAGVSTNRNYVEQLRNLASSLAVADKINFLGNRSDVLDLMSKASALVVPSRSEGFGLITAEAMFSGSVVIGKDIAGTKEQFDNGFIQCGEEIGLRYLDDSELVKRMCEVMDNGPEYYSSMIDNAQKTVLSLYTIEQHIQKVLDFYRFILKENNNSNKSQN